MEKVIYIDVLFLINLCVDFLALGLCGYLLSKPISVARLIPAALSGAAYSVGAAYFGVSGTLGTFLTAIVALFMCFIALDFSGYKGLFRITATFVTVNILLGGVMEAVYGRGAGMSPGVKTVITAALLVCGICAVMWRHFIQSSKVKNVYCDITLDGMTVRTRLLCDSGNLLKDPYNGKSVVVVSGRCFREISRIISEGKLEKLQSLSPRIIPISVAGGRGGMLYGFVPESIKVLGETADGEGKGTESVDAILALDLETYEFDGMDGIIPTVLV